MFESAAFCRALVALDLLVGLFRREIEALHVVPLLHGAALSDVLARNVLFVLALAFLKRSVLQEGGGLAKSTICGPVRLQLPHQVSIRMLQGICSPRRV